MPRLPFAMRLRPDRRRVVHAPSERAAADPTRAAGEALATLRGPGWFESSWDLRAGLEVREGWPDDVRLDEWLDGFCGSDRPSDLALAGA